MKIEELKEDPIIFNWIDTINPNKKTEKNYLTAMRYIALGQAHPSYPHHPYSKYGEVLLRLIEMSN